MPAYTGVQGNLQHEGPLVIVQLAVGTAAEAALKKAGDPVPTPIRITALVDTGAARSVIRQGLAAQLKLHPIGTVSINSASQANVACPEYSVRLIFPQGSVAATTVVEMSLQGQGIDCLIGRDILAFSVLVYIGPMNQFTLSF